MPQRSLIDKLPPSVRAELNQRLRQAAYGDLRAISMWMTGHGHPIKTSQLGVYSLRLQAADRKADATMFRLSPSEQLQAAEVRVRCLQIAAASGPKATLLDRAERYADWVFRPAPKFTSALKPRS